MPDDGATFHKQIIPQLSEKFFKAYHQYLTQTKDLLISADVYSKLTCLHCRRTRLHRNVYIDQDFLNQVCDEFKAVFKER